MKYSHLQTLTFKDLCQEAYDTEACMNAELKAIEALIAAYQPKPPPVTNAEFKKHNVRIAKLADYYHEISDELTKRSLHLT